MPPDHDEHLQRVLRGLIAGADPARLLHEALVGAVTSARGRTGLLLGVMDGTSTPLASTGPVPRVVVDAAEAAIASGRLARRSARDGTGSALAEPLRVGVRVVGALGVGGDAKTLDPARLPLFADSASLALGRRPGASASSVPEVLDAVASMATNVDRASVLVRLFDAAEMLFGASGGFCALFEAEAVRVAQYRGIDLQRLRAASRHPEFKALLTAPALRVDSPAHPVVALLVDGAEHAVGLPLFVEGRRLGHLVLFLGQSPDAPTRAVLTAFARHAALALRSAELYRRLGDKEEQLTSVVNSMANPVLVVDHNGRLAIVNGAAAELFHLAAAFELGQPVAGRLGHDELEQLLTGDDMADDQEGQLEVSLGAPAPHVYRATVRPVHSSEGRSLGRVLVLDDITKDRETDQIKADFVAVIGHELRTPLTVLKGYVRTLLRRAGEMDGATLHQAIEAIDGSAVRLERLLEDLLLVSAIESQRPDVVLAEEDLGKVVEGVVAVAGDRVVCHRPRGDLVFPLDRTKIEQVLLHLLDNALKYAEGQVDVEVTDEGDDVVVAVVDRGPGIFSGDIPNLFERFHQLDGSSTRTHGGTGVGLYICRRLVELQGGRIWCDSRLGVGSRFAFSLPRVRPSAVVTFDDELLDEGAEIGL